MAANSIARFAKKFETLCIAILKERGVDDETGVVSYHDPNAPDYVGINRETKALVIAEFNLSISSFGRPSIWGSSIARLKEQVDWYKDDYENIELLLVTTSTLSPNAKQLTHTLGITVIWDLPRLIEEASHTTLYGELRQFLSDVGVGDLGTLQPASVESVVSSGEVAQDAKKGRKGKDYIAALDAIPQGAPGWRQFELVCTEVIDYLFSEQFGSSHRQSPSEGGMHRRDLLVRLRPTHDFWIALAHDFRSRYILFEFKNYEGKIGQDEIYSTEKYLFTTALRSVCFLIARNGADESAHRAASGALREAGKLIMIFDLQDIHEMLTAVDEDQEPEILLYGRLDELLTKMLR
jgi:hypothetical protein